MNVKDIIMNQPEVTPHEGLKRLAKKRGWSLKEYWKHAGYPYRNSYPTGRNPAIGTYSLWLGNTGARLAVIDSDGEVFFLKQDEELKYVPGMKTRKESPYKRSGTDFLIEQGFF